MEPLCSGEQGSGSSVGGPAGPSGRRGWKVRGPWQGSWRWLCVAEAVMAVAKPAGSELRAGSCHGNGNGRRMLGGQRGLCAAARARLGAALAGDLQVPGVSQLVLSAQGAMPAQPNPRALQRDAAFNRQRKHKRESSSRQEPEQPPSRTQSHPRVPNLPPVPSRAWSSQPLAQSTAGAGTPSLVWPHSLHWGRQRSAGSGLECLS